MLDATTCGKLARQLDEARRLRCEIEPLSKTFTELDLDDAYRIGASESACASHAERSSPGTKWASPRRPKREQMGLAQSVYGGLTDAMRSLTVRSSRSRGRSSPLDRPGGSSRVARLSAIR